MTHPSYEALVERAQRSVRACEQLFTETGMTPLSCLEEVRRLGGDAAVRKIESEVGGILDAARDQVEREASHAPSGHVVSRRVAFRGGV